MRLSSFKAARRWSNRELRRVAPLFTGDVVNVSGWEDRDKEGRLYREYFANARSYAVTNAKAERGYEGRPGELLLDLAKPLPRRMRRRFDVVFNHTTLEWLYDVRGAARALCELSRDAVVLVLPTAAPSAGKDFWRFTEHSARKLLEENGMKVVYLRQSRNLLAPDYLFVIASRKPAKWLRALR